MLKRPIAMVGCRGCGRGRWRATGGDRNRGLELWYEGEEENKVTCSPRGCEIGVVRCAHAAREDGPWRAMTSPIASTSTPILVKIPNPTQHGSRETSRRKSGPHSHRGNSLPGIILDSTLSGALFKPSERWGASGSAVRWRRPAARLTRRGTCNRHCSDPIAIGRGQSSLPCDDCPEN